MLHLIIILVLICNNVIGHDSFKGSPLATVSKNQTERNSRVLSNIFSTEEDEEDEVTKNSNSYFEAHTFDGNEVPSSPFDNQVGQNQFSDFNEKELTLFNGLLSSKFFNVHYVGKWHRSLKGEELLKKENGKFFFRIVTTLKAKENDLILIRIFDGSYSDDDKLDLKIPIRSMNFNNETKRLVFSPEDVKVTMGRISQKDESLMCKVNISLTLLLKMDDNDFSTDYSFKNMSTLFEDYRIKMEVTSRDCDLNLTGEAQSDTNDYLKKTMNYSFFTTFLAILQLSGIVNLIKTIIENEAEANKYSILTLGLITSWDSYLSFLHFHFAVNHEIYFQYFLTISFWYFLLFIIFEIRLLVLLWRIRYFQRITDAEQLRDSLFKFNFKFYTLLTVLTFIIHQYILNLTFDIIMNLYLIPQIIHNAMRGQFVNFNYSFYMLFVASRCFLFFYIRGCPENIFNISPAPIFCLLLALVVGGQLLVLFLQSYLGPRFFVPNLFLPPKYNYFYYINEIYTELREDTTDLESNKSYPEQDECAICMGSLNHQSSLQNENQTTDKFKHLLRGTKYNKKSKQVMKTPCDHKFHVYCLVEWMSIKMECPSCRSTLPNL